MPTILTLRIKRLVLVFAICIAGSLSAQTLDIAINSAAGYGTPNPYSPGTGAPYYCDPITFSSSASSPMTVAWNFGNPESPDNATLSASGTQVVHMFAGLTTSAQISAVKTVTAANVADPAISATTAVSMQVPTVRVRLAGTSTDLLSVAEVLRGDKFTDASDGSVEGHFDVWTIDGVSSTRTPLETIPIDGCGAHTLALQAHYVPYAGSGASIVAAPVPHFVQPAINISYVAKPFIPAVAIAAFDATTITFGTATRAASASTFVDGATWSAELKLVDGAGGTIYETTRTTTIGSQDSFAVPRTATAGATRAVLTIAVDPSALSDPSCLGWLSASAEIPLAVPDPMIQVSGCTFAGQPCTLKALSATGASQSDWTYQWKLNSSIAGTSSILSPAITVGGTYTVELTASNAFGAAKAMTTLVVGSCSYTFNPTDKVFPSAGGSGSFTITTAAGCAWTAVSYSAWIGITGGKSGTGNGTVTYTVAANTGAYRKGTIKVGQRTFYVIQDPGPSTDQGQGQLKGVIGAVFESDATPGPELDASGDCAVTPIDVFYLINAIFAGGAPVEGCPEPQP